MAFKGQDRRDESRYDPDKVEEGFRIMRAKMARLEYQSEQNKLAVASTEIRPKKRTRAQIAKANKEYLSGIFHRTHTIWDPFNKAIVAIVMATLAIRDDTIAESLQFLILSFGGYVVPALYCLFGYSEYVDAKIKSLIFTILAGTIGIVWLLSGGWKMLVP